MSPRLRLQHGRPELGPAARMVRIRGFHHPARVSTRSRDARPGAENAGFQAHSPEFPSQNYGQKGLPGGERISEHVTGRICAQECIQSGEPFQVRTGVAAQGRTCPGLTCCPALTLGGNREQTFAQPGLHPGAPQMSFRCISYRYWQCIIELTQTPCFLILPLPNL